MISGKSNNNKPIEEFILASPTSLDTAAKLGRQFFILSIREKDRAKDLEAASKFCEMMATELMAIAASTGGAGAILRAVDSKGTPFLDVLIENEQKEVVAHSSVQKYVTEVHNLALSNYVLFIISDFNSGSFISWTGLDGQFILGIVAFHSSVHSLLVSASNLDCLLFALRPSL